MQSRSAVGSPDALEAFAQSAGQALPCTFSSSDEYEAAIIAERRAEGRYGSRRPPLVLIYGIGAAVVLLLLLI